MYLFLQKSVDNHQFYFSLLEQHSEPSLELNKIIMTFDIHSNLPNKGKADADTTELSVRGPKIGKLFVCFLMILTLNWIVTYFMIIYGALCAIGFELELRASWPAKS